MAFLQSQRNATMLVGALFKFTRYACAPKCYSSTVKETDVKKSVFISQSNDIFSNLALEDWLFRKFDFTHHHILMLWRNSPSVVIGQNQNPWLETNVSNMESGIKLARRSTDAGAIYNDLGNLNLTFFSPLERYNKRCNTEIITRGIFRKYGLKVNVTSNEELTLRNSKYVSGNTSKLGGPNSYHNCTLLIETNKINLKHSLQKQEKELNRQSTGSASNRVMNLCDENPKVTVDGILEAIGWEYMRTTAFTLSDGGLSLANKQNGFQMVNPTDAWFPGLQQIQSQLSSWEWCYGKTPKFSVCQSLHQNSDVHVFMDIAKGRIEDANVNGGEYNGIIKDLIGTKYSTQTKEKLESFIGEYRQKEAMTSM